MCKISAEMSIKMDVFNQNQIFKRYISRMHTDFIFVDHGPCPDWIRPPHKRRRDTLYLILDGKGCITINGKSIFPVKNDLVLLPRNSVVSLYAESATCYHKYWCDFIMQIDGTSLFDLVDFPYIRHLEDISYARTLFDRLDTLRLRTDAKSALLLEATLLELVALFLEDNSHAPVPEKQENPFADQVSGYIHRHIAEKLSVRQLAREMHFNEKYFISLFKQHFATTPAQYIKTLRLELAKQELLYSDDNISLLIERIGYAAPAELSKDFKSYTGLSPTAFRRKYR